MQRSTDGRSRPEAKAKTSSLSACLPPCRRRSPFPPQDQRQIEASYVTSAPPTRHRETLPPPSLRACGDLGACSAYCMSVRHVMLYDATVHLRDYAGEAKKGQQKGPANQRFIASISKMARRKDESWLCAGGHTCLLLPNARADLFDGRASLLFNGPFRWWLTQLPGASTRCVGSSARGPLLRGYTTPLAASRDDGARGPLCT